MVNSSLGYEILLYLNTYYYALFVLVELCVIIFKITHLPYPTDVLISEVLILIFLSGTEILRLFMGHKGNLTEKTFFIIASLILTIPSVLGIVYFLIWQTYVLRLEIILCGVQLTLEGLELCFAFFCLAKFCRAATY